MKSQVFTLKTWDDAKRAVQWLDSNWRKAADSKKPLVLSISEKDEDYSSKQRRLYWLWITQYSKHFGEDKNDAHLFIKRKFLINIYRRDDDGFASMCDAIAKLKDSEPEEFKAIGEGVISLTSITKATKQQMTELLDSFFMFANGQGLRLTCPDDLKFIREMAA